MPLFGRAKGPSTRHSLLGGVGKALIAFLVLEVAAIVVFRLRWRPAIDAIRRFNRVILNPVMMRMAGREHWYASVVHHVGRATGEEYATPVWAERSGSLFYIPLPYGVDVDWCLNILASGSCALDYHGDHYTLVAPEVVPAGSAAEDLSWRTRARFEVFGVHHYLRLAVREASEAAA